MQIDRREFLRVSTCTALALTLAPRRAYAAPSDFTRRFRSAPSRAVIDSESGEDVEVIRQWNGNVSAISFRNRSQHPVRVREIVIADMAHEFAPETPLYGESFQMLSQTAGTISQPLHLGYDELQHYRIPQPEGVTALSGLVMFSPPGKCIALAFTSCHRFAGRFYLSASKLVTVLDCEGLEIAAGETMQAEELMIVEAPRAADVTAAISSRIIRNHPPVYRRPVATGWCSWYCFGPRVTAEQVLANLDVIANQVPGLRYVQIDDGYQPAMGDWLETGQAFGGEVQSVLREIRKRGFEPAIWVAPFIAEKDSHLFQQHPDWFMKDSGGQPLPADKVTFRGWRHGPWYALDGTHPEVQKHFEDLFRTMRRDWGCTYFKLDANFWGAMHGGRLHDRKATRIEAYRRGMEAIRRGAGDAFILGCNHPIWPSLGLIDGSRSSGDIKRTWENFKKQARQTLSRNWQNGTLWWNDPDAVLLTGTLSEDEYQFHATAAYASGGMVLSGDDLTQIPPQRLAMLRKLLPPTGTAAKFEDASLRVGFVDLPKGRAYCIFNWDDAPHTVSFRLRPKSRVHDFWNDADLGKHSGTFELKDMPPHSARLLICS